MQPIKLSIVRRTASEVSLHISLEGGHHASTAAPGFHFLRVEENTEEHIMLYDYGYNSISLLWGRNDTATIETRVMDWVNPLYIQCHPFLVASLLHGEE